MGLCKTNSVVSYNKLFKKKAIKDRSRINQNQQWIIEKLGINLSYLLVYIYFFKFFLFIQVKILSQLQHFKRGKTVSQIQVKTSYCSLWDRTLLPQLLYCCLVGSELFLSSVTTRYAQILAPLPGNGVQLFISIFSFRVCAL